jgi:outer membrane cobalamin receptor
MRARPSRRCRVAASFSLALLVLTCGHSLAAGEPSLPAVIADLRAGEPLVEALATLNRRGIAVAYSTAIVDRSMTLLALPSAASVEELLAQMLSPWKLRAIRDASGEWLVVRASDADTASAAPGAGAADAAGEEREPALLQEMDVTASRHAIATALPGEARFIDREQVSRLPHLMDDAVRLLKALPGVAGGDYSAQLNIRGGRRDEVLLLVDGVEIQDPFHIREVDGVISLIDTNLVERIGLTTGGMTAEWGDRMSGIVDIHTRRPQPDDPQRFALGVSFINAFARAGGAFADGRGSWLASARRGYMDLIVRRVQDDDEEFTPRYQDAYAKFHYDVSDSTSLSGHVLLGTDDLTFLDDDGNRASGGEAETAYVWSTLDHAWSDSLRTLTIVSASTVDRQREADDIRPEDIVASLDNRAEFEFLALRQDWSWQPWSRHLWRWGLTAERQHADYDYQLTSFITDPLITGGVPIDTSRAADVDASGWKAGVYASYRTRLAEPLTLEVGVRADRYHYPGGASYDRASPRFNLVWRTGTRGELRASWSIVHQPQGINELQVEDGVTDFFAPEEAEQAALGYSWRLGDAYSLRLDTYWKDYSNLRARFENALDPHELIAEAEPDRVRIDAERARARGVEFSIRRDAPRGWKGWLSYAYSQAEDLEDGTWRPRTWDQSHAASFGVTWAGAKWSLGVNGIYHSGWPTTDVDVRVVQQPNGQPALQPVFGERNGERLAPFSRLDLRASRRSQLDRGVLTWYFEVYNLLDRDNQCCVEDFKLVDAMGSPHLEPNYDYWLPLLPSFGFQYEF